MRIRGRNLTPYRDTYSYVVYPEDITSCKVDAGAGKTITDEQYTTVERTD